ncbi:uncharacterized protein TNCV_4807841 [Trichonephila clavipes]|nr:uncharacterized protein TNCV_4807841 [Trichonephila clavipes]
MTAVPWGLGSNPREGENVCKCIVSSRYGSTLNSRRVTSPLVRLVEGEERWEAFDHPQSVLPQNWGGNEQNRTVTCMMLKAKVNDIPQLRWISWTLILCYCPSDGISNNTYPIYVLRI